MPISRPHALICLAMLTGGIACGSGSGTVTPPGVDSTGKDIFTRGAEVLTWSQAQKVAYYPKMDSIFPAHVAARGTVVHDLPAGAPVAILTSTPAAVQALNDFIVAQQVAGLRLSLDREREESEGEEDECTTHGSAPCMKCPSGG